MAGGVIAVVTNGDFAGISANARAQPLTFAQRDANADGSPNSLLAPIVGIAAEVLAFFPHTADQPGTPGMTSRGIP